MAYGNREKVFQIALIANLLLLLNPNFTYALTLNKYETLHVGCYRYTDELISDLKDNLSKSSLPAAFLGKQFKEVDCSLMHHFEIAKKSRSRIQNNLKMDTLKIRPSCLKENISNTNPGHQLHSAQILTKVWRSGDFNQWICGVKAKSYLHPTEKLYNFYESFYGAVLKGSES